MKCLGGTLVEVTDDEANNVFKLSFNVLKIRVDQRVSTITNLFCSD